MKKAATFLLFGLLPLWIAIALMFIGGQVMSDSPGYWTVAPWLVIASLPLCVITLIIVGANLVSTKPTVTKSGQDVEEQTRTSERSAAAAGKSAPQYAKAATYSVLFVLVVAVAVGVLVVEETFKQQYLGEEKLQVEEYVKKNAVVKQAAGDNIEALVVTYSFGKANYLPVRYDVAVSRSPPSDTPTSSVHAIVDVSYSWGKPVFTLACINPLDPFRRESYKDPCEK